MNKVRRNIPPKTYAVKRQKPKLRRQVEQTLTNKYGQSMVHPKDDATNIDTYYVHGKDAYYQGNWMGGLPHGWGISIYPDGSYYYGNFDEGEAEDKNGFLILPNGALYLGNISKSKCEGRGKLVHKLGYSYQGEWHNNKPHGIGRQIYQDGSEYQGHFANGLKHCFDESRSIKDKKIKPPPQLSTYRRGDEIYRGEFRTGLMHGYGELINKKKNVSYCGEFNNGQKEGFGSLETQLGKLSGNFHSDVVNGQGIFQWRDGRRYDGQFRNSKFDGQGRITFPQGNSLHGTWKEGQSASLKAVFSSQKQSNQEMYNRNLASNSAEKMRGDSPNILNSKVQQSGFQGDRSEVRKIPYNQPQQEYVQRKQESVMRPDPILRSGDYQARRQEEVPRENYKSQLA